MTLKQQLQVYQAKLDAVTLRERGLVLMCGLALVYMFANLLWLGPQGAGLEKQSSTLKQLTSQLQSTQTALQQLQQIQTMDPDAPKKRQVQHLQQELDSIDQQLGQLSVGLVRADQLPAILENMVAQTGALKLIKLETLPVTLLQLNDAPSSATAKAKTDKTAESGKGVYKHSTAIVVEGSYFQVLGYVKALENLDWRFYWDSLHYEVSQYPSARVEIQVYTLSTDEGLLGV